MTFWRWCMTFPAGREPAGASSALCYNCLSGMTGYHQAALHQCAAFEQVSTADSLDKCNGLHANHSLPVTTTMACLPTKKRQTGPYCLGHLQQGTSMEIALAW